MTEKAEEPPGTGNLEAPAPKNGANHQVQRWALHLAVLLTILIALLWLIPLRSPSPALLSTPMDSGVGRTESEPPLPPLKEKPPGPTPAPAAPGSSQLSQQARPTAQPEFLPLYPIPTDVPQVGRRPQRPRLLTSRGGARPAAAPAAFTLIRNAVPHTTIPERPRLEVITYTVQPGDTLLGIAQKFKLDADTIMWASGRLEDHPDLLRVGQVLTILPVDGIYHTVQEGETLESIAKKYKVDVEAITQCEYNDLKEPYKLTPGQKLIVPGGKKPYKPRVVHIYTGKVPAGAAKGTGVFGWPTSGVITQKFWARHKAIDIGAPTGTPVVAADSGYVAVAGWSNVGYGKYIVIDHGNGFQTLYAHLSAIFVKVGQSVGKGERIGSVGSTGHSTGPHLHFEIRYKGVQRNPFGYLP